MRNINLKQILLLMLVFFFLFGDFFNLKKKLYSFFGYIKDFVSRKSRKKGT